MLGKDMETSNVSPKQRCSPIKPTMKARLLLFCYLVVHRSCVHGTVLSTLRQTEQLRTTLLSNWIRVNNVDVHESMNGTSFCHIADLDFYSMIVDGGKRIATPGLPTQAASVIAMAMQHLNAGDGSVVPEVEGLNQRCNVRFTTEFLDTGFSPSQAVDKVIDVIGREDRQPCAFLGAASSAVSMATATVSGLKGFPQLSWISVSSKLSDAEQFPLFARLTNSLETVGTAQLEHIYTTLGVRHLAVVYSDDVTVIEEINALQTVARLKYPDLHIVPIAFVGEMTESTAEAIVAAIKASRLTYVLLSLHAYDSELLLREAYQQGVIGTQNVWTFRDLPRTQTGAIVQEEFTPDDPLLLSLRGALRLEPVVGTAGVARYDAFVNAWKEIGSSAEDIAYLRSKLPSYPDDATYQPVFDASTFETPGPYFAAAYDAAILLGLAACGTSTLHFTGQEMYDAMLNVSFVGASGYVGLEAETKARSKGSGMFRLMNSVASRLPNGNFTLNEVEVGFFDGTHWNLSSAIIFNDGTETAPAVLPPTTENCNFLDSKWRYFGLVVSGIVVLLSAGMSLWTCTFQKTSRAIQAAQPLFLHLICVGTALMGLAVVPLSIDDGVLGEEAADTACLVFPWLLTLGWAVSFSALFSKTMRVNKLFHNPSFRRVVVTASDVMRPMVLLLLANVLILLLWSVLSPLRYDRIVLSVDQFQRPSESHGYCTSDLFWWFFIPLAALNFAALVVANQQAFVARKISTEFAESDYISRAMGLIVIVALMVVPVGMMSDDKTNMHFFVTVCFVGTVALSLLLYIFVPKILYKPADGTMAKAIRGSILASASSFSVESNRFVDQSDMGQGEIVVAHPKLAVADMVRLEELEQENKKLVERIAQLKVGVPSVEHAHSSDDRTDRSQSLLDQQQNTVPGVVCE